MNINGQCGEKGIIKYPMDPVWRKTNFLTIYVYNPTTITTAYHIITSMWKKIPSEMIHPNVSDLPGLLLRVVLAVHSAVDR